MRYTNDLPGELKKVLADALTRINSTREKDVRELLEQDLDVEVWMQTWGSTALGFGGIGGQAITSAPTFLIWAQNRSFGLVYFATRFAYEARYPFSKYFHESYARRQLPAVREAHRLRLDKNSFRCPSCDEDRSLSLKTSNGSCRACKATQI